VILAAGLSARMGGFKPLLEVGGVSLLGHAIGLFRASGIASIHAVAGFQAEKVCAAAQAAGAHCVVNAAYADGMFTSVQAGLSALKDVDAFFLLPVDVALIKPGTIGSLMRRFRPGGIFYPLFQGRRGHPPLIDAGFAETIASWRGPGRLDLLLNEWESKAVDVPVADEAIGLDADTAEDFQVLSQRYQYRHAPSRAECLYLMEKVHAVDPKIIAHGLAVAAVAGMLGESLNGAGCRLDLRLIESAALVHDIARDHPDHARAGAFLIADSGYPQVAEIVAAHMEIVPDAKGVTATEIVYLADKFVKGERLVDLESRFGAKLRKYGRDPGTLLCIRSRQRDAEVIIGKVEGIIGKSIGEILPPAGSIPGLYGEAHGD